MHIRVWTPYGLGLIADYRSIDDKIEVILDWGSLCYLSTDAVVQLTNPSQTHSFLRIIKELREEEIRLEAEEREKERVEKELKVAEDEKQRLISQRECEENEKMKKEENEVRDSQRVESEKAGLGVLLPSDLDVIGTPRKTSNSLIPMISRAMSPLNLLRIGKRIDSSDRNKKNDSHSNSRSSTIIQTTQSADSNDRNDR
jgi:hypothetical protein